MGGCSAAQSYRSVRSFHALGFDQCASALTQEEGSRLAPLADLIGSGLGGDQQRKEVTPMYRWEVPKVLARRLARDP